MRAVRIRPDDRYVAEVVVLVRRTFWKSNFGFLRVEKIGMMCVSFKETCVFLVERRKKKEDRGMNFLLETRVFIETRQSRECIPLTHVDFR